ncbi:oligosaccharide flippase family protein [Thioalkalivibrio sp. ALE17]|uniref:oligosaccharide flippase family protein n=1 Tax=Thioalkalivibrio sp. ALE17 TaxID=1158173 RepID=UPI000490A4FC|nr:oligosaccharide flippase family protein [Thioalkalivibrio sp. ALE17]
MNTAVIRRLLALGQGDGLRAQLVRGAMGVGGLKLLSLPLTLAASILLARALGPEGYGQYVFVMAVIALLALPIGPGLGQLVTREVARYHHGEDWSLFRGLLRRAHQWVLLGSVVIISAVLIVAGHNAAWAVDDRWTLLFIASLMLPLLGLNALRSHTLRGLRHVFQAQLPELLARPAFHLLFAGVLLVGGALTPATALGSQIAATALAFLLGAWLLSRCRPAQVEQADPDYRHGEWGRALLPFTLLAAVSTLNAQIGILALGWLGTDEDVAALRVAQQGAMLVVLSLTIVNLVIGPHITGAHRDGNHRRLQTLSRASARVALIFSSVLALPMLVMPSVVLDWVFGAEYAAIASMPLVILVAAQLINVGFGAVGMLLMMTGNEKMIVSPHLFALVANGCLCVALIPKLGASGAAVAAAVSIVSLNILLAGYVSRVLNLRPGPL